MNYMNKACDLLVYIPLAGFTKPTWVFATFFTYAFYISSHCMEIYYSTTRLLVLLFFIKLIDITQVILDIMATYKEITHLKSLPFTLVIFHILVEMRFDI